MSRFLTALDLRDLNDGEHFQLIGTLGYRSDLLVRDVYVPAGFVTDFASVPRGLWNILPRVGQWDRAAVVHDFLYATNGLTRAQADAVFKEALCVCGVSGWRCTAMYAAVRCCGWKPWNRYRVIGTG